MAKIYVSSTFLDLQEHRAQVEKVIRRMGHDDVAMEYYVAEDQRPVVKCLADIAECDVYVGIFAWRSGTPAKGYDASITEMEFREAEKHDKPCLIFLLSDDALWPRKFIDKDATKIENLRDTARTNHTADYFTTPDELARKVAEAIYKLIPAAVPIPEHNLTAYYNALRKRYGVLALEGLTPPQKEEYLQIQLRSVFVEQSVRENPPPVELPKEVWEKLSRKKEIHSEDLPSGITLDDVRKARESYYEKPTRFVLDVLTDPRHQYTIILGDPGSGKSTLARYVILSLVAPSTSDDKLQKAFAGYLPLLIELRTYTGACSEGNCGSFLEFLEYLGKTEGWALTQSALHNHLKNDGRAVVIFDGLDEIFDSEQREQITRQIVGFCNDYPKARIIVTSRVIGYRRKILTDAGFTHFTLQDLDEKQVESFITRWYDLAMSERPDEAKERRERILKSFQESASIRQLAGNPMLLTIMAIIGKHQELPRERWKLYDHAASVLIQHWDVNKHLKDQRVEADFIGEDDKKELLRRLAFRMQSGEGGLAGNYIHREQLQAEFEGYLRERYGQMPDRAKVIAEAMIQQFRERNFILSLYGANLYGFVHRAFLEYFCAFAFVWKFEKTKELTIEQLKTEVYGKHWEDQSWHEVLRLICGMLDEKWAGELIDYLVNEVYRPWPKKFGKRLPWNIALAVQCLSDIRISTVVVESAARLLNCLCVLLGRELGTRRDVGSFPSFLVDNILPSIKVIGQNWPQREMLDTWLRNLDLQYASGFSAVVWGRFVGLIGQGLDQIHEVILEFMSRGQEFYRIFALTALVEGWRKNPQSFQLLCKTAINDPSGNVRSTAVWRLAADFSDVLETVPTIRQVALADKEWWVRSNALLTFAEHLLNDPQSLALLHDRVTNDKDYRIRRLAVFALANYCRNDAETYPILSDCALRDVSPEADSSRDNPEGYVRDIALNAIVKHWPTHPDTLPLLRDRTKNDPTPWLRKRAKQLIAELEGKKE